LASGSSRFSQRRSRRRHQFRCSNTSNDGNPLGGPKAGPTGGLEDPRGGLKILDWIGFLLHRSPLCRKCGDLSIRG
jgi:hypothetical protein